MADIRIVKTCKSCGKPFSISQGELKWLKEKNLMPFERCGECRAFNRQKKLEQKRRGNNHGE